MGGHVEARGWLQDCGLATAIGKSNRQRHECQRLGADFRAGVAGCWTCPCNTPPRQMGGSCKDSQKKCCSKHTDKSEEEGQVRVASCVQEGIQKKTDWCTCGKSGQEKSGVS